MSAYIGDKIDLLNAISGQFCCAIAITLSVSLKCRNFNELVFGIGHTHSIPFNIQHYTTTKRIINKLKKNKQQPEQVEITA